MRHKKKGNHLSRTTSHKKALMRNMVAQIIEHKEIKTTIAKAKELRGYVERLVTYGKKGTLHHRRLAFKFLQNKEAVKGLFDEVAPTFETREGGYTRIIKLGNRRGDGAPMSVLQLVGFEKSASKSKPKTPKKDKKKADKDESAGVAESVEETAMEEKSVEKPAEDKKEEVKDLKAEEIVEEKPEPEAEVAEEKTTESDKEKDDPKA
ncbi:MAG: 50S ribosomal protein L17 [Calditrichaceae bacterium]|nr:50S ribosomal protein L17 [Calditrichaceae bacterium]